MQVVIAKRLFTVNTNMALNTYNPAEKISDLLVLVSGRMVRTTTTATIENSNILIPRRCP